MPVTARFVRLRVRNRADDDDLLVLSTKAGDDCLVTDPPDGEGQKIDWAEGKLETGSYTWFAWDEAQTADTRAITKLLADDDARDQILGNRAISEESENGTDWDAFHTGYLVDYQLKTAGEFSFSISDTDRREQKAELFRTVTDTFDRVCCIIGGPVVADPPVAWSAAPARAWGPVIDYGPARFEVIANPSGLVDAANRITLSLVSGNFPPIYLGQQTAFSIPLPAGLKVSIAAEEIDRLARKYFEYDAEGKYKTDGSQDAQPWGSFPGLEAKLTKVIGGAVTRSFPIAQETTKRTASPIPYAGPDYPIGDYSALVANSNKRLIVAWDAGTMGAAPTAGTRFDVLVYPRAIDKDNPIHLRGHPIELHTAANDQEGIPYVASSATATKAAIGTGLFVELRIDGPMKYADFTKKLRAACGYGIRYNADGEQEFFPTLTDEAAVGTITPDDIIADGTEGPTEVILKTGTSSVISGVDYQLKVFRPWNPKIDEGDRPMDGVIAQDQLIEGRRAEDAVPGDRILTYDLPGQILLAGGAIVFNQAFALREWVLKAGDVIIDRRGWAAKEGAIEVLDTIPGNVGDYLDSEAPHQVNAKVGQDPIAQRGGTRKLQIVGRTKRHGTALLLLEDAGNLAQDPPEAPDDGTGGNDPNDGIPVPELSLAPSADDPLTVATVTVDNAADLTPLNADVELEYLVQTATPDPADAGTAFGPVRTSTGDDDEDAPAVASGETLWVRGRTKINATGQQSEFSDWISITLGPDDDGSGGVLPPIDLSLAINTSGVLSAAASGIAAIVKVYFAAGAAGGAAPSYATTLAGMFDNSVPFTASPLATMAEGEVRTVGAIGEDALGNRTILVTRTISRGSPTKPDLSLALTIDEATGNLSALASVNAIVTSVKFAVGATGGAAPSSALVRAATADSSAPFESGTLLSMLEGETRTVGAFAYDVASTESLLVTATITRGVAPGGGGGGSGGSSLIPATREPIALLATHAGRVLRLENIPSASADVGPALDIDLSAASDVAHLTTQVDVATPGEFRLEGAVGAGAYGPLDGAAGPVVSVAATGPVVIGAEVNVDAAYKVANARVKLRVGGGDGTGMAKVRSAYLHLRASDRIPIPSDPGDLPTGGAFGSLIFDGNAISLFGVLSDGDAVATLTDDTGVTGDAVTFGSGTVAPIFKALGLGDKPSVRFNGSTAALRFPMPSTGAFTIYYVIGNLAGSSPSTDRYPNGSQILSNQGGGSGQSFGIALMADGKISYGVGENFFVTTSASKKTTGTHNAQPKNLHTFIRNPTGGHFFYWVDGADESPGGDNSTGAALTEVPHVYIGIKPGVGYQGAFDLGRLCWWNAAHGATEIAAVKALLQTQWGTP